MIDLDDVTIITFPFRKICRALAQGVLRQHYGSVVVVLVLTYGSLISVVPRDREFLEASLKVSVLAQEARRSDDHRLDLNLVNSSRLPSKSAS